MYAEKLGAWVAKTIITIIVLTVILLLLGGFKQLLSTPNHPHPSREMIDQLQARCLHEAAEWTVELKQDQWGWHDFYESYRCRWPSHRSQP